MLVLGGKVMDFTNPYTKNQFHHLTANIFIMHHMRKDEVVGKMEIPENNLDIAIIKSDGLPTYHFAHYKCLFSIFI